MYNGIGLTTPRGSATNGFIQRNAAYRPVHKQKRKLDNADAPAPKIRKPNAAILEHQRKREVELKLVEWAAANGIDDLSDEEEANRQRDRMRKEFTKLQERGALTTDQNLSDTHQRSAAKEMELERVRNAFRVDESYNVGDAFDKDVQMAKKQKRYEEKVEREKQKFLRELEREKEKEKQKQIDNEDKNNVIEDRQPNSRQSFRAPRENDHEQDQRQNIQRTRSRSPDSRPRRYPPRYSRNYRPRYQNRGSHYSPDKTRRRRYHSRSRSPDDRHKRRNYSRSSSSSRSRSLSRSRSRSFSSSASRSPSSSHSRSRSPSPASS